MLPSRVEIVYKARRVFMNPIDAWVEPGFPEVLRLNDSPEYGDGSGVHADLDLQQALLLIEILRCQSPVRYDFGDLKVSNSNEGVYFEFRLLENGNGWWRIKIPFPCLDDFISHLEGLVEEMQPKADPLPWHLAQESYEQRALECARDLLRAKKLKVSQMEMDRYFSQLDQALQALQVEEFDSWMLAIDRDLRADAAYDVAAIVLDGNVEPWDYTEAWNLEKRLPVDMAVNLCIAHYRQISKGNC